MRMERYCIIHAMHTCSYGRQFTLSLRVDALEDCVVQAHWRAAETVSGAQITFAAPPNAPEWPHVRLSEGREQLVRFESPLDRTLRLSR